MTHLKYLPKPRKACLNKIIDPTTKEQIDNGLLLWFPDDVLFCLNYFSLNSICYVLGPKSFTGENCCEFQVQVSLQYFKAYQNYQIFDQLTPVTYCID